MSYAVGFGVELAINAILLGVSLMPASDAPKAKIGCGSRELGGKEPQWTLGGKLPHLFLYDVQGRQVAADREGRGCQDAENIQFDVGGGFIPTVFDDPNPNESPFITPEYARLSAWDADEVCITYVSVASGGTGGDKRFWHAGYAKQCVPEHWYPSPDIVPSSDFRPGCIWIGKKDAFLHGISFKLTDFAFPTSDEADQAKKQWEDHPATLCNAPARQAFWKWLPDEVTQAGISFETDNLYVPYYPFVITKNDAGNDTNYQRIVDGHVLPEEGLFGELYLGELQPGQGPITLSEQEVIDREKQLEEERKVAEQQLEEERKAAEQKLNEDGENPNGAPPGTGSFGGFTEEELNEAGLNPNAPAPGAGSFGGVAGQGQATKSGGFIAIQTPIPDASGRRRRIRKSQPARKRDLCEYKLVISFLEDHSALDLCKSPSRFGPDFASTSDGWHCNMCTKELTRLCDRDGQDDQWLKCFDLSKKLMRYSVAGYKMARRNSESKTYDNVSEWRQ